MAQKPCVVMTDLDNTLYDWVDMWYQSFTAMVDFLTSETGIDRERLLDEIQAIHQRHGTSEYAFVAYDLPSLRALPLKTFSETAKAATQLRNDVRDRSLALYPGVLSTLKQLRRQGVLIVGYTESMSFYSASRVLALELDGLLDYLFSPTDHAMPTDADGGALGSTEAVAFKRTVHHHTPLGELKPNPRVLRDIIADVGAKPSQVIYVGDSLLKDVIMAQDAGISDVLAAYGKAQDRAAYELLRRVTHWTAEDVTRERNIIARGEVIPTYVLNNQFSELLELFQYSAFTPVDQHRALYSS